MNAYVSPDSPQADALRAAVDKLNIRPDGYDSYGYHPIHGFKPGVSEGVKRERIRAKLAQQQANAEWLAESDRPFVPKDLDKFRSSQCVTNFGEAFNS